MTLGSHQQTIGKSQTHFTPRFILNSLGPFDLDPCAGNPRPWDCAYDNFSLPKNGLLASWYGRVWLNPAFNRYEVGRWIERLAAHGKGVALVHARTETDWFEPIWRHASAILFLADRLKFCLADGSEQPANSGAPAVLAAFGDADSQALAKCGLRGALVTEWGLP